MSRNRNPSGRPSSAARQPRWSRHRDRQLHRYDWHVEGRPQHCCDVLARAPDLVHELEVRPPVKRRGTVNFPPPISDRVPVSEERATDVVDHHPEPVRIGTRDRYRKAGGLRRHRVVIVRVSGVGTGGDLDGEHGVPFPSRAEMIQSARLADPELRLQEAGHIDSELVRKHSPSLANPRIEAAVLARRAAAATRRSARSARARRYAATTSCLPVTIEIGECIDQLRATLIEPVQVAGNAEFGTHGRRLV